MRGRAREGLVQGLNTSVGVILSNTLTHPAARLPTPFYVYLEM